MAKWEAEQNWVTKDNNHGWCVRDTESGKAITGWGCVTQSEENARLMASAPQLLEACERVYRHISKVTMTTDRDRFGYDEDAEESERISVMDELQAAIRAAEGECAK